MKLMSIGRTKVLKKDKSAEPFKTAKLVNSCIAAGVPEPIAKSIAKMIAVELKGRATIPSSEIKDKVFKLFDKVIQAKKSWVSYTKKPVKK